MFNLNFYLLLYNMGYFIFTCGSMTKLFPAEEQLSDEDEDISELVGEGGKELVPPLLPILPLLEN